MRKKILIIIVLILVAAVLSATVYIVNKSNKDSLYIAGCEFVQVQSYEEALECFEKIENYKDTNDLLKLVKYNLALNAFNAGDLNLADEYFNEILGYNDSSEYVKEITYQRLLKAIDNKELEKADELALKIVGYKDVEYQQQRILFDRYMLFLDANDLTSAEAVGNTITNETLKQKAARVLEYSRHGYGILNQLRSMVAGENASVNVKEIRCYQYSYNNNVEVPIYMIYTEYTGSDGNVSDRYYAFLDSSYYGYCDTIVRSEIDMKNETQLYTFLKIEPYWDEDTTLNLSIGLMEALASSN